MNKSERIKKYLKFISSWLQTNTLESTELFACLETKNEPYGVLLTDSRYKTDNGKELYTILKGSTIPFYSTVDRRDVLINKLIDTGVIEQKNDRYVFLQNSPRLTIGTVRKLVNTTDGRWPLPLFSTLELGINTEFKLKEPVSRLNKTFKYSGIKLQIVQGIFIINDKIIKLSFEEVIDYVIQHYGKKVSMYDFADSTSNFMTNIISGDRVKEAEHSILSDSANKSEETDSLSEKAQQQSADIANRIYKENKERERIEYEKKLKSFKYEFEDLGGYVGNTLDYNEHIFLEAVEALEKHMNAFINGTSNSGKTFMAREIAGKFCNVDTRDFEDYERFAHNLMWVQASMDRKEFLQKFVEFCVYNKNSERCLIVINEADKNNLNKLLVYIWDSLKGKGKDSFYDIISNGKSFTYNGELVEIPKGLRILANVCCDNPKDLGQIKNRFPYYANLDDIRVTPKFLSDYTGIRLDISELLLDLQNEFKTNYGADGMYIVIYDLKYKTLESLEYYYEFIENSCSRKSLKKIKALKDYIEVVKNEKSYV